MQPRFQTNPRPFPALLLGLSLLTLAGPVLAQFQTNAALPPTSPTTFAFTGSEQYFYVPTGVTALTVVANGAQGGGGSRDGIGGLGGRVTAVLTVVPGQALTIYVGGQNGYNGGGKSGTGSGSGGGSGGGATDIRTGGTALANRVLVAGGGGGSGSAYGGGAGGGTTGANGPDGEEGATGGGGGSSSAGGAGGVGGPNPSSGVGGAGVSGSGGNGGDVSNSIGNGGGGGGGYFGGGGGGRHAFNYGGGGGGGSSYTSSANSNVVHVQGAQTGNGSLTLSWTVPLPAAPTNLQRKAGATYTPTDITLQWTDNSTNEANFVLERGKRTSASQLITDNTIVWTAASPNPAANTATYRDYSTTGLTTNPFGYFYRIKAVNSAGSSAYAYNTDGALPVTLRYVNGRMTESGALLAWATAREDNNAYFQIERSRDALGFESIGTVPSQAPGGNALTELTYTFTDAQPLPAVNYYRLMQTDRDGTRTQAGGIIALSRENQPPVLFPNPLTGSGEATIEPAIQHTGYQISDVLGRIVQRQDAPGVLSRVSLVGLPAGVYLLRVQTGAGVTTFRLLR